MPKGARGWYIVEVAIVQTGEDMSAKTFIRISVEETSKTRHYWASRPSIDESTTKEILSADVLIVPCENRSGTGDTFPQGTTTFSRRLSKGLGLNMVAFAVERDSYQELSLHADHIRWPTVAVTTVAFGIFASVVANEIDRLMHQPKPPETLEMELIVENSSGVCISIQYLGPPSRALETFVTEASKCFPREIESESDAKAPSDESQGGVEGE